MKVLNPPKNNDVEGRVLFVNRKRNEIILEHDLGTYVLKLDRGESLPTKGQLVTITVAGEVGF